MSAGVMADARESRLIADRQRQLLLGARPDSRDPILKVARQAMRGEMENALEETDRLLANPQSGQYAIAKGAPKSAQNELRQIFDLLPRLALAYQLKGSDSPHYQNPEVLKKVIDLLDLLHRKGFNPGFDLGIDVEEARVAMETLGFFGFGGTLYNQLDGYPTTLFLLEDELKAAGLWKREMETLHWTNQLFLPDENNTVPGDRFPGYNSDGFRKLTRLYFPYVLLLDDEHSDKERYFRHWRAMLAKALEVSPGFADTFKPDGTGYHHKGVYVGAYSPSTFLDAAIMKWLLEGTSLAYSETEAETVMNAYRAMRIMSEKYDTIQGTGGRFPANASPVFEMLPGYAFLETPEADAMFARLWLPERLMREEAFIKRVGTLGIGALERMVEKGAEGIEPEPAPEGFWMFPYAGLAVHRRGDWMACVKGQSQYVWNYESSSAQNLYGYHGSSAALTILKDSRNTSGYAQSGWDWEHIPGTTTPALGMDKVKSAERQLIASPFMGGVALDGRHGLFAAHHQFVPGKKAFKENDGEYPVDEGWLQAFKSCFFFDDEIVALGSDIKASKNVGEVTTTLFQAAVEEEPEYIGNKRLLSDGVGNYYVVPDVANLKTRFGKWTSKTDRGKACSGRHAAAWFEHGATPSDEGYEYAILVQSTAEKAAFYADQPAYRVLRQDHRAHIVSHPKKGLIGYALFEAGAVDHSLLIKTDKPCMAMIATFDDGFKISVCNPDFGRVPEGRAFSLSEAKEVSLLYKESELRPVRITLRGKWDPAAAGVAVVARTEEETTLEFPCIKAKSVQTTLRAL